MKWTNSQEKAINEKGNILVSASAGSGKTTVLVERIMSYIKFGYSLDKMVILVYNNQAAEELRRKIRKELFESGDKKLIEQIDNLPFVKICTMHAFCLSLVRENFDCFSLEPSFEIATEDEMNGIFVKALSATIKECVSLDKVDDEISFADLITMFGTKRNEDGIYDAILTIYKIREVSSDREKFLSSLTEDFENIENSKYAKVFLNEISKRGAIYYEKLNEARNYLASFNDERYQKMIENITDLVFYSRSFAEAKSLCDAINILFNIESERWSAPKDVGEDIKAIQDLRKSFLDWIKSWKGKIDSVEILKDSHIQNKIVLDKLIGAVKIFSGHIEDIKNKKNKLSFSDLEHYALELFKNEEYKDRAEMIKENISLVYVDEYQDVNAIQEAIIRAIAPYDSCFMVGDYKQCIYGFRLADPQIFIDKWMRYCEDEGGLAISLNDNFRSKDEILYFVNDLFSNIMTMENCHCDYKSVGEESSQFNVSGNNKGGSVEIRAFKKEEGKKEELKKVYDIKTHSEDNDISSAKLEGEFVANEIERLIKEENFKYGDFAILFSKRSKSAQAVCEELLNHNIPLSSTEFIVNSENPEKELVLLLQAIDNPYNEIPFAGFLLSYFGGYDENELVALGRGNLYDNLKSISTVKSSLGEKAKKTLCDLDRYRLMVSMSSVAEFLHKIVYESGYSSVLRSDRYSDVEMFIDSLEKRDSNESISKFLQMYAGDIKEKVPSVRNDEKASVMTMHASKGLEFPVVFLCSLGDKFRKSDFRENLVVVPRDFDNFSTNDGNSYIGIKGFDKGKKRKFNTLSLISTLIEKEKNEMAERIRLFYVATTRAKERLYLCGEELSNKEKLGIKEMGDSYMEMLFSCYPNGIDKETKYNFYLKSKNKNVADNEEKRKDEVLLSREEKNRIEPNYLSFPNEEIKMAILNERKFKYKWEDETTMPQKMSVSSIVEEDREEDFAFTPFDEIHQNEEDGDRRERINEGNAYHAVMEQIDFGMVDINQEFQNLKDNKLVSEEYLSLVNIEEIGTCLKSPIISLAKIKLIKREQPFTMLIGEEDKILVQGVIDLMIFDDDGIILVDYKNSSRSDEELIATYKKQLDLYRKAVEKAGKKVKASYIYSFKRGKEIRVN